jgi:hypothetical protein
MIMQLNRITGQVSVLKLEIKYLSVRILNRWSACEEICVCLKHTTIPQMSVINMHNINNIRILVWNRM